MTSTPEILKAYLAALQTIVEAVAATGDQGIPSGQLYAHMMDKVNLAAFESLIDKAVSSGCLTKTGHLLKATPAIREAFEARQLAAKGA